MGLQKSALVAGASVRALPRWSVNFTSVMELEVEPSVVVFTALALLVAAAVLLRRRRKAASDDGPTSGCLAAQLQTVPEPKAVSAEEPQPVQESQSCAGTVFETDDHLTEPVSESVSVPEAISMPDPLLEPTRLKVSELFPDPVNKFRTVKEAVSESEPVLASHLVSQTVPQPAVARPEPVPVQETNPQLEPVLESLTTPEAVSWPKPVCESLLAQEPVPETVTQPEPELEILLAPEPVPVTVTPPEPVLEPLSIPESIPELKPVCESLLAPKPIPESLCETLLAPEPVPETVTQPEPVLSIPETVSQPKPVCESLLASEPVPETVTQPEPARETLLAPEPVPGTVTQLESATVTCSVQEHVSESTVKPVLEQILEAKQCSQADPEVAVLVSDAVSVAQVVPEEEPSSKPVSEVQSVIQSESAQNEVLQVVADQVSVHLDQSGLAPLPRSDKENPLTSEPVAEQAVDVDFNGEVAAAAVEEDKVTFTPGKKANKFETLMTKEELEEEQS
ncbi:FILIA-N KH-like domain-containing protein isoform X2 [Hippocampus zosterae]|uniref:FILIA-N KH-like domain-containing protein isoform X2 n=1 Tax=Hippocampus zosterae TaxID=109293 RepID=UPI00223E50A0|nr:FILIA-N KH-like domain-containing protein isoform X2 [Hippocampus zosterae]